MADETPPLPPASETGGGTPPSVAERQPEASADVAAVLVSARSSVPNFGGIRGGRERLDGLVPGSKEAEEADKLYGRIRKFIKANPDRKHPEEHKLKPEILARFRKFERREAAARSGTLPNRVPPDPPALPAAVEDYRIDRSETKTIPVVAGDAVPAAAPVVPWDAAEISELSTDLLVMIEEADVKGIGERCTKAKLPDDLQREIVAAANWPESSRKILKKYLPRVLAKYLNMTGISSEHAELGAVCGSVILIGYSRMKISSRLDELIKKATPAPVTVQAAAPVKAAPTLLDTLNK